MNRGNFKSDSMQGYVAKEEMPPYLSNLFRARRPLDPVAAMHKPRYEGLLALHDDYRSLDQIFQEAKARHYADGDGDFGRKARETKEEKKLRIKREQVLKSLETVKKQREQWKPHNDKHLLGTDQYRTIFVGRLAFETTEERLKREFDGIFGDVVSVRIVKDLQGKSQGYGFIEFSEDRMADDAVRRGDGRRVDGRRIIVDRELGRTKATWYPRRLGGGKGEARRDKRDEELIREIRKQIESEGLDKAGTEAGENSAKPKDEEESKGTAVSAEKQKQQVVPSDLVNKEIPVKNSVENADKATTKIETKEAQAPNNESSEDRRQARASERERRHKSSRRRSKSRSRSYSPSDRHAESSSRRDRYRDERSGYHHRERDRDNDRDRSRRGERDFDRRRDYSSSKGGDSRRHRYDRDRSYDERGRSGDQRGDRYPTDKASFYVSNGSTAVKKDASLRDQPSTKIDPVVPTEKPHLNEEREDGEI